MTDFLPHNSTTHPIVRLEDDYNNLLNHGLESLFPYRIRKNGSQYEGIKGGTSSGAGTIVVGGSGNLGGATGTDFGAVYTATAILGNVWLCDGVFTANTRCYTPSNRIIAGTVGAVVQPSNSLAQLTFDDQPNQLALFRNTATGASNITLQGFSITNVANVDPTLHAVHFHECSDVHAQNLHILDCPDGIDFTQCTDFTATGNVVKNADNCGISPWQASKRGLIANNTIIGDGSTSDYGIIVTGCPTIQTSSAPCEYIKIMGNQIFNVAHVGIWLQGGALVGGVTAGSTRYCRVLNNTIDTVTNSTASG